MSRSRRMRDRWNADGSRSNLWRDRGATAVEYGVILTLFVAGMFGGIKLLNTALNNSYNSAESRVGLPQSLQPAPSLPSYDPGICDPSTQWFNGLTGACDAKAVCTGTDFYNAGTNTCDPMTSCPGQFYVAATNSCEPLVTSCPGQFLNVAQNRCDPLTSCPGEFYVAATNSCEPLVTSCSPGDFLNVAQNRCDPSAAPGCASSGLPYDAGTNTCGAACVSPNMLNTDHAAVPGRHQPVRCEWPALQLRNQLVRDGLCVAEHAERGYVACARRGSRTARCTNKPYDAGTNTCGAPCIGSSHA